LLDRTNNEGCKDPVNKAAFMAIGKTQDDNHDLAIKAIRYSQNTPEAMRNLRDLFG